MEAKIQYFQSPMFGQIRVTVIDDKPMFVANDVAAMLGYSNRYDAINRQCLPTYHAFQIAGSRAISRLGM